MEAPKVPTQDLIRSADKPLPESKAEMRDDLKKLDEGLGNHLLTRIPTAKGSDVLIFNGYQFPGSEKTRDGKHISVAGFHPEEGPIIVTSGSLGWELSERVRTQTTGTNLEGSNWDELLQNAQEGGPKPGNDEELHTSEIRNVGPEDLETWRRSLDEAAKRARSTQESERRQRMVIPQALSQVKEIAQKYSTTEAAR